MSCSNSSSRLAPISPLLREIPPDEPKSQQNGRRDKISDRGRSNANGLRSLLPDLPGCIATGSTRAEVESNMREAIAFHLDGLRKEGQPVPEPQSYSAYVELPAWHAPLAK